MITRRYNDEVDAIQPNIVVANLAEFVGRYPNYKLDIVSVYLLRNVLNRQLRLHFIDTEKDITVPTYVM